MVGAHFYVSDLFIIILINKKHSEKDTEISKDGHRQCCVLRKHDDNCGG